MFEPNYFNLEYFYYKVYLLLQKIGLIEEINGKITFAGYWYFFALKLFLIFISVFVTFMAVDFLYRLIRLRRDEKEEILSAILANMATVDKKNLRWEKVQELLSSDNESDLKLAVIEADKMLDDLLSVLGYRGESIGEKLQMVEKGDMESLDQAWEAHKFRNRIAHESGFQVTQREARRIIALYGNVFREYEYI